MRTIPVALAVLVNLAALGALRAELIAVRDVPAAVMKSAEKAARSVPTWHSASRVRSADNRLGYELLGKNQHGTLVMFRAWEDGTVVDVRTDVGVQHVSVRALKAMSAKYPGFKADYIWKVGRYDGEVQGYIFVRDTRDRKDSVVVSIDGTKLAVESGEPAAAPAKPAEPNRSNPPKPAQTLDGDLKAVQGTWLVIGGTETCLPLTEKGGKGGTLVVQGARCELRDKNGRGLFAGELKLDPRANPKAFDLCGANRSVLMRGIYTHTEKSLHLTYRAGAEAKRPRTVVEVEVFDPDLPAGTHLALERIEGGR
jgi:uncharacterized protein (TIGR03067 family)